MKKILKEIYKKILINPYFILFGITFLIMLPFTMSGKYVSGDDTNFHMSNIYMLYNKIIQGNIFSQILPGIAKDFGYATGIFYPRLAHVCSAIFTIIFNGNVVYALKVVHFIVYYISSIMMYKLVNRIFKNKFVSLIAGIFYITFPYSITEVFTRNAIAESFVFIFTPMIILGLYELFYGDKKKFYLWFILGYIGIINSHLVLSVYFTALVFIYLLLNIKKVFNKENFKALVISSVLILLISLPFIIPLLEHKALGTYCVFESEEMSDRGTIVSSTLSIREFFEQKPCERFSNIRYYLNLLGFSLAFYAIMFNKSILKTYEQRNFFKFLLILTLVIVFLMCYFCPWRIFPKIMIMIQFVWRLETILVLSLSILAAMALKNINSKKIKILCLLIVILFNGFTVYKAYDFNRFEYKKIKDIDISDYGMGWQKEYLPMQTKNNIEYFENRNQDIIIKDGNADINILENNTPYLKAEIKNIESETTIELPRIYYLGYEAKLMENETITKLELHINDNGFIETKINSNGILVLEYKGTLANKIANYIAIITIIGILIYLIIRFYKKKEK